jgi:hypothetical protein
LKGAKRSIPLILKLHPGNQADLNPENGPAGCDQTTTCGNPDDGKSKA